MYLSLVGEPYRTTDSLGYHPFAVSYYNANYTEIYQNLTIPRGEVRDAYISFDYYAESAMKTNELFLYCEINNQKIYSIGFRDIVSAGREIWHSTGKINMDLWVNNSNIFDQTINNQDLNISVGIMSGAGLGYTGFEDRFQQVLWLDNVSLVLTTLANSSQDTINLTINNLDLNQGDYWGKAYLNITGNWDTNPVILTVNTTALNLA